MRLVGALALVLVATASTAAGAFAPLSPKAELAAMRSAVLRQHSVHYVSVNSAPGYEDTAISDVGQGKGVQRITFTQQGETGPAQVRVVNKVAYIKGTVFTMHEFFGFPAPAAAAYAGRWISIPSSDHAFKVIADGAT